VKRLPQWLADTYAAIGCEPDVRAGKKHAKIYVDGRVAAIVSHDGGRGQDHRSVKNCISNMRRAAKGLQARRFGG
jgi:hypothetical protein